VEKHWDGIIAWHTSHLANGLLEGINSLVQAAKARARGYRNKNKMITIIYLTAAKLLLRADGENAVEAVNGRRFAAVLCHGVLGYLEQPEPLVNQLCRCAAAGGVVSIMAGNAKTMAVRPALERRWDDALAAFDATGEVGVLGVPTRADTVEHLSELMQSQGVEPLRWYGVWLFTDWLDFSGAELDLSDSKQVAAMAAVELEASRRDPYRQLSRPFHLVGRKRLADGATAAKC
jgi:S-adenosylmethionine-dependent methyltransferase